MNGQWGPDTFIDALGNTRLIGASAVAAGYSCPIDSLGNLTITGPAANAVTITVTPAAGSPFSVVLTIPPLPTEIAPSARVVNTHPLTADVTVTASDVGLGAVNNTADTAKPVSTAQAAADTVVAAVRAGAGLGNAFAGVLATLRRGHRSACVAVIGDSTADDKQVGTGIQVNEWALVFIKRLGLDFGGYTILERQWNDTNQSYDQPLAAWQTGTINSGTERCAIFTKTVPGALQFTGTAITGDIDIRVRHAPTTWTPTGDQTIAAKWESTGNNRSVLFLLKTTGALGFNWSVAGTAGFGEKDSTATIPATANPGNGNPLWTRVTLTVNNGAAGNDVKFYYSTDGVVWTQLGATVTTAGTTSVFGGTAPYQIGSFTSGLSNPYDGKVHRVEIHPGLPGASGSGASVVPYLPDDWDWDSGETTLTFGGAPILTFLNGSQSGQNVAYFDNATRRVIVHQPHGQSVLMISTAHNDVTQSRAIWLGAYNTMVTNIKALIPYVPIVAVGQNPVGLGGSFSITQQGLELRAARSAILQQWAASQAGVWSFDAWPLLVAPGDLYDQLHPTTGTGSGSEKWGLNFYARAFPSGPTSS